MRGKLSQSPRDAELNRITPAHAGKTGGFRGHTDTRRDHPRACGENSYMQRHHFTLKGSPPRMRGKLLGFGGFRLDIRITPAHAGKTYREMREKISRQDHPRACGENR